jgi:bifunctional DNA-binding transcriptional regulator/antitoxin component of YhaV-PrlF toxin-antitoxin module
MTSGNRKSEAVLALDRPSRSAWLVRVDSRGRITLPLEMRRQHDLRPGNIVAFHCYERGIRIELPPAGAKDDDSRTGHTAALPPKRNE